MVGNTVYRHKTWIYPLKSSGYTILSPCHHTRPIAWHIQKAQTHILEELDQQSFNCLHGPIEKILYALR